ncbi:MAG: Sua5/YciO/YrdC/YwlC family protein [Mycoplasma sp.]|nr:Sua5/YciO/YrdC/YwlC family protein [Mycoplasma sp.]
MKKYEKLFIAKTDTVVGIGGPVEPEVEKEIFELKGRPKNKPLIIMVNSIKEAKKFDGWNENAEKIAKKFWPGQVTIVLSKVAIRIPNSKELLDLINKIGPIYMTSANKSEKPTLDFKKAVAEFPEIKKYYSKTKGSDVISTIIRAKDLKILRQGIIYFKGDL